MIPNPTDAPYGTPGELFACLSCHAIDTSSGNHRFLVESDCRVCHHPTDAETVEVDIKPGSNRYSFKLKSKGVLPVSILGSVLRLFQNGMIRFYAWSITIGVTVFVLYLSFSG